MKNNESGMGLVSVMMAVAIAGILIMMTSQAMVNQMNASASVRLRNDVESIRMMVEAQTSCNRSLPRQCTPNMPVNLIKDDGSLMTKTVASFSVRATCNSTGDGIVVQTARLSKTDPNTFLKDPLTKKDMSWKRVMPVDLCGLKDRGIECYEATRQNNTYGGIGGLVTFVGTTKDSWGMECRKPFFRSACSLQTLPDIGTDTDIRLIANGCTSDNEEWDERAIMHISCCRQN